jgi:hypothetical protein
MTRTADISGFPGLSNPSGRRFINPSYRMGFSFYPQPPGSPFDPARSTDRPINVNWAADESDGGLASFQWSKNMGQGAGNWTAVFKELGKDDTFDFRTLVDGDWADVYVLRNGLRIPLCRGMIDQIRERKRSSGGATVREWLLTGRDHGLIWDYPITWTSVWVQTLGEISQGLMTAAVKGAVGGRPDEIFRILTEAALGAGKEAGQWELPPSLAELAGGKRRFWDTLKLVSLAASKSARSSGLRGSYWNEAQLWNTGAQTLHQALQRWCNPMLNEIYYDLLPPAGFLPQNGLNGFAIAPQVAEGIAAADPADLTGAIRFESDLQPEPTLSLVSDNAEFGHPAAYIRERPFISTIEGSASMWFSLPTWTIPDWLILQDDLGYGGHERYNLFELLADIGLGTSQEQPPQAKPVWNRVDIRARGLRAMQQSTHFLAQFNAAFGGWLEERKTWQRLLVDWYGPSPYLRQGQITVKAALPEIRIGHRLIIDPGGDESSREQFYVEGVSLNYAFPPGSGSTTLTVTHGFKGTDAQYLSNVRDLSANFVETA